MLAIQGDFAPMAAPRRMCHVAIFDRARVICWTSTANLTQRGVEENNREVYVAKHSSAQYIKGRPNKQQEKTHKRVMSHTLHQHDLHAIGCLVVFSFVCERS